MDIRYFGPTKLKLTRTLPKEPNSCRISVYANAINHILGTYDLTPELILKSINERRVSEGQVPIVLSVAEHYVTAEDLDNYTNVHFPQILVKRVYGEKYVDPTLWKTLLNHGFVFGFYHQMLYDDFYDSQDHEAFTYMDKYVSRECVIAKNFDYKKFKSLCELLIRRTGAFDAGHVDLVLDVVMDEGVPYVVFANLNFAKSSGLVKVPFNLLKYFGLLDWEDAFGMTSSAQLPPEVIFNQIREKGRLNYNGFNFIYGVLEIFCLKSRAGELDALLVPKKRAFPTPLFAILLVLLAPLLMFFADRGPKINTTSLDINNPVQKTEQELLIDLINKNKPTTSMESLIIGDDICKVFSKDSIAKITKTTISNTQNFAEAGAVWCEYTIDGQTPSTLTIYTGNVSADSEKASLVALGRVVKTLPDIKANHFVVEDADGSLQATYLIINKNRFVRLDRSSRNEITDQSLIDLANNLKGFQ